MLTGVAEDREAHATLPSLAILSAECFGSLPNTAKQDDIRSIDPGALEVQSRSYRYDDNTTHQGAHLALCTALKCQWRKGDPVGPEKEGLWQR